MRVSMSGTCLWLILWTLGDNRGMATGSVRTRIGFRVPIFGNAFISVVYLSQDNYDKGLGAIGLIQALLISAGQQGLADRFVFEKG